MTLENLKTKVKSAFIEVDSLEFLEKKIQEHKTRIENEFRKWILENPNSSLDEWKLNQVSTLNLLTDNNNDLMAIGIYLLALDQL